MAEQTSFFDSLIPDSIREQIANGGGGDDDTATALAEPDQPRVSYTAMEAAEAIIPSGDEWRRRETIRRRVQELENPYELLEVIGEREGAKSKSDNHIYAITELGREALSTWQRGVPWTPRHLARSSDPETAKKAARKIRPQVDFHRVLMLYAGVS